MRERDKCLAAVEKAKAVVEKAKAENKKTNVELDGALHLLKDILGE